MLIHTVSDLHPFSAKYDNLLLYKDPFRLIFENLLDTDRSAMVQLNKRIHRFFLEIDREKIHTLQKVFIKSLDFFKFKGYFLESSILQAGLQMLEPKNGLIENERIYFQTAHQIQQAGKLLNLADGSCFFEYLKKDATLFVKKFILDQNFNFTLKNADVEALFKNLMDWSLENEQLEWHEQLEIMDNQFLEAPSTHQHLDRYKELDSLVVSVLAHIKDGKSYVNLLNHLSQLENSSNNLKAFILFRDHLRVKLNGIPTAHINNVKRLLKFNHLGYAMRSVIDFLKFKFDDCFGAFSKHRAPTDKTYSVYFKHVKKEITQVLHFLNEHNQSTYALKNIEFFLKCILRLIEQKRGQSIYQELRDNASSLEKQLYDYMIMRAKFDLALAIFDKGSSLTSNFINLLNKPRSTPLSDEQLKLLIEKAQLNNENAKTVFSSFKLEDKLLKIMPFLDAIALGHAYSYAQRLESKNAIIDHTCKCTHSCPEFGEQFLAHVVGALTGRAADLYLAISMAFASKGNIQKAADYRQLSLPAV